MSKTRNKLVICIDNTGYHAALERRKIYECLPDSEAAKRKTLRIIDESGEDYLYPESMFVPASLPEAVRRAILKTA